MKSCRRRPFLRFGLCFLEEKRSLSRGRTTWTNCRSDSIKSCRMKPASNGGGVLKGSNRNNLASPVWSHLPYDFWHADSIRTLRKFLTFINSKGHHQEQLRSCCGMKKSKSKLIFWGTWVPSETVQHIALVWRNTNFPTLEVPMLDFSSMQFSTSGLKSTQSHQKNL